VKTLEFRLDLNPPTTTHQAKQIVRVGKFTKLADKPGLTSARSLYCALLSQYRPAEPVRTACRLTIAFTFPWRKSESKKTMANGTAAHTVRPDCSNLAKTFEDCLVQMGFIQDDALVTQLVVTKCFGSQPGVMVRIEGLEGEEDGR
jgi:Holliday junction resolvase RusA-like endonuclease